MKAFGLRFTWMVRKFSQAAGSFSTWVYCLANGLADRQTSSSLTIEDSIHQKVMDKHYRTEYNIQQHWRGTSHKQIELHSEDNVPKEKKTTMSYGQLYTI